MRVLARLPNAHLHVRLGSTIRRSTLREIGAANGVDDPVQVGDGLVVFDGFRQFAEHSALVRNCLRRPRGFVRIAQEFCADEAAQSAHYAEVTFTAASHGERREIRRCRTRPCWMDWPPACLRTTSSAGCCREQPRRE